MEYKTRSRAVCFYSLEDTDHRKKKKKKKKKKLEDISKEGVKEIIGRSKTKDLDKNKRERGGRDINFYKYNPVRVRQVYEEGGLELPNRSAAAAANSNNNHNRFVPLTEKSSLGLVVTLIRLKNRPLND